MKRIVFALLCLLWGAPAAAQIAAGTVAVATAASGTASVTGLNFQPKCGIFVTNGRTSATDETDGTNAIVRMSVGFVGAAGDDERSMAAIIRDGQSNTDNGAVYRTDAVVTIPLNTGAFDGWASIAWNADGFTLTTDDSIAAAYQVQYLVWGGAKVTNCATFEFSTGAGTGAGTDVTTIGFQPDAVIFATVEYPTATTPPAFIIHGRMGIGFTDTSFNNYGCAVRSQDNTATTNTASYAKAGDSIVSINLSAANLEQKSAPTAWLSNGFSWTRTTNDTDTRIMGLAVKGGSYAVGSFLTQTDTTTDSTVSGLSFAPQAIFLCSAAKAASADGTPDDHADLSIGVSTAADAGKALAMQDEDGVVGPTESATGIDADKVYLNISTADAVEGVMNLRTLNSDGATFRMSDADPAQASVGYFFIGGLTSSGPLVNNTPLKTKVGGLLAR